MSLPIIPGCQCLSTCPDAPGQCTAIERILSGTQITGRFLNTGTEGTIITREEGWMIELHESALDRPKTIVATRFLIRLDGHEETEQERELINEH